eukprot:6208915-Pleurochrysis_carterae.AAC.1
MGIKHISSGRGFSLREACIPNQCCALNSITSLRTWCRCALKHQELHSSQKSAGLFCGQTGDKAQM